MLRSTCTDSLNSAEWYLLHSIKHIKLQNPKINFPIKFLQFCELNFLNKKEKNVQLTYKVIQEKLFTKNID